MSGDNLLTNSQLLANIVKSSKVLPMGNAPLYEELHQFRKELEVTPINSVEHPYEMQIKSANLYRLTFLAIGFVFALLMFIVHYKTASIMCNLIITQIAISKAFLSLFCGLLSTAAFTLALLISPEKEAVNQIFKRSKRKLKLAYHRSLKKAGLGTFLLLYHDQQAKILTTSYQHILDKMEDQKKATLHMLQCIKGSSADPQLKIKLYNQAIMELRDRFNQWSYKLENT